jgi:hypothetical protein
MHAQTNVSVVIRRPPAEVFARLIDFGQWPQWGGGNLVSLEQVSTGPLQVGSQLRQVNKTGRKPTETLVQVTHLVPNQVLGIERSDLHGTFALEAIEAGTRLNVTFAVEATGLNALLYWMFLKQFVTSDLRKFKTLVEAGDPSGYRLRA